MKLLLDDNGNAVLQDGKPVYEHEDGQKIAFDAPASMAKIKELNGEAAQHRTAAKTYKEKLEAFGDVDPNDALKALDTIKNLEDKKLIDAGEVEALKRNLSETFETEKNKLLDAVKAKDSQIYGLTIGSQFSNSKYITEKLAVPADMIRATFSQNFKIEDDESGKPTVVGYLDGNKIFSRERPGELADFEESMQVIVDKYPMKDHILKSSDKGGSGSDGGQHNSNGSDAPKSTHDKYRSGLAKLTG